MGRQGNEQTEWVGGVAMAKKYGTPENLLDTILGGGIGGSVSGSVGGVSMETQGRGLHMVPLDRLLDNPYQAGRRTRSSTSSRLQPAWPS